jgi:hypothetical protein
MSNITSYIRDTAEALDVPKEAIYDIVIALIAIGTDDEDIEGALKIMAEDSGEPVTKEGKDTLNLRNISGSNTVLA